MKPKLDLVLSIKRGVWRRDDLQSESADREFRDVRPRVMARDGSRCAACGLPSEIQDVHHIDDDHGNNTLENLATADPLCHGVHHIGQVGIANEGRIVFMPELSQEDLNHLQRTCFIVLDVGDKQQKAVAMTILKRIIERSKVVEKSPWGTSSPLDFAVALKELGDAEYGQRDLSFQGLRLAYHPKRFARYLPAWVKALAAMPMTVWASIHENAVKKASNA